MNNKETQQCAKSLLKQIREVKKNIHQFQEVLHAYDNTPDTTTLNRAQPTSKSVILTPNRAQYGQYHSQNYNNSVPRTLQNNLSKSYDDSNENSYLGLKSNHTKLQKNDNDSFHYLSSNEERNSYLQESSNHQNSKSKENEKIEKSDKNQKRSRSERKHKEKDDYDRKHKKSSKAQRKSTNEKNDHRSRSNADGHQRDRKRSNYHSYRGSYYSDSDYDESDELTLYTVSDVENLFSSEFLEEIDKYPPKSKKDEKENQREEDKYDRKERRKKKDKENKKMESKQSPRSRAPKTALSSDTEVEQIIRRTEKYRKSPKYLEKSPNDKDKSNKNNLRKDSSPRNKNDQKEISRMIDLAHYFAEKRSENSKHSQTTPQGKTPKTQTQVSDLDSYDISSASGALGNKNHEYNRDNDGYSTSYGLDSAIISPKNASHKTNQDKHASHKKQPTQQKQNKENKKNKSKYGNGDPLQCVEATIEEISESQYSSSVVFIPPQPDTLPFSPNKQQRNQKQKKQPKKTRKPKPENDEQESSGLQAIHDRINELHLSSTTSSELAKNNAQNKNESEIDLEGISLSSNFIDGLKTPSNVSEIQELTSNDGAYQDNANEEESENEEEAKDRNDIGMNFNSSEFNKNNEEDNLEENSNEEEENIESLEENTQEEDDEDIDLDEENQEEDDEDIDLDEENQEENEEENQNDEDEEQNDEDEDQEQNDEDEDQEQNDEEENQEQNEEDEDQEQNDEEENQEQSEEENEDEEENGSEETFYANDIGVQTTLSAGDNEEESEIQNREADQFEDDFIKEENSNEKEEHQDENQNSGNEANDQFSDNLLKELEEEEADESLSQLLKQYNYNSENGEEDIDINSTELEDLLLDDDQNNEK
ncbi:hypothetical protein M9Y10_021665 [Tritrichomonas musculus]|uniref:Uncharacterized protein n=1 Tax=Tritrichomonas musculus TaxID=1915356 RepID=A0ABR2KQF2_9EUKA